MSRKVTILPTPLETKDTREEIAAHGSDPLNAHFDTLIDKCVRDGSLTLALPADDAVLPAGSLSRHRTLQRMTLAAGRAGVKLEHGPSRKVAGAYVWFAVKANGKASGAATVIEGVIVAK